MNLEIPNNIFQQMLKQAKAEAPIKACGILGARLSLLKPVSDWKLDVGYSRKSEFQASITIIETNIDNLKRKLYLSKMTDADKLIVVILPETGERYLSTELSY